MSAYKLNEVIWVGKVVDVNDPLKSGRVRVNVFGLFDNIPDTDVPWASPQKISNGKEFSIPNMGQIINVHFPEDDNVYNIEYQNNEHYNINLQNTLEALDGNDYIGYRALHVDHTTQLHIIPSKGLVLDHELSNINIDNLGNINMNLRDQQSFLFLGSPDASQSVILGDNFIEWFSEFLNILTGLRGPAYIGNMSAPVIPGAGLLNHVQNFTNLNTQRKILSDNVFVPENRSIQVQQRLVDDIARLGDAWSSNVENNEITIEVKVQRQLEEPEETIVKPTPPSPGVPPKVTKQIAQTENANIPDKNNPPPSTGNLKSSKQLEKHQGKSRDTRLVKEAADAWDELMLSIFPKTAKFTGKMSFIPTSGYRSYEEQQRIENHLYKNGQEGLGTGDRVNALRAEEKKKGRRLKTGEYEHLPVATGTHGSGIALDVGISGLNTVGDRKYLSAAFRHPMFQQLVDYGEKFGLIRPYLSAPYPIEQQHQDYVGTDKAKAWNSKNIPKDFNHRITPFDAGSSDEPGNDVKILWKYSKLSFKF